MIVQGNDSILNHLGEWLREWYQKHQLIKATIDWSNRVTEDKQLIRERLDCDKASDSFQSNRIATDLTNEWLTKPKNKYKYW